MSKVLIALVLLPAALSAQNLEIHHIDANQGDATLFVMPNGTTLLVDAGFSFGGEVIVDYLDSLGISQLDAFVLTHYDQDHLGGADRLVHEGIGVSVFCDRGEWDRSACAPPDPQEQLCQYQQTVEGEGNSAIAFNPGDQILLDSAVSVVVVASNARVHPHDAPLTDEENARSVALLISYNGFDYLLGGTSRRSLRNGWCQRPLSTISTPTTSITTAQKPAPTRTS